MTNNREHYLDVVPSQIDTEAASWVAQLDAGPLSAADKLALAEWMTRSPKHAQELKRLSLLWGDVDDVIDDLLLENLKPNIKLTNFFAAIFSIRPFTVTAVLATCFATVFVMSEMMFNSFPSPSPEAVVQVDPVILSVDKGEDLVKILEDGSIIHLNTETIVQIKYTPDARTVTLIRGEGLFEVQKDPHRPFLVYAGDRVIQAVGTAFVVRFDNNDLFVTVTEGKIRLDKQTDIETTGSPNLPIDAHGLEPLFLEAGQKVVFDAGAIQEVASLNVETIKRQTAWTQGDLVFEGDTLSFVMTELSRYNTIDISMEPELREIRMGGTFKTSDVDRILQAVELSMNIKVKHNSDGSIYLSKNN